jgi:hypothetical protein
MSMDHHPTSFLVIDNKELGTFWIGQANIKPGANDRAVNVYQLIDKLSSKYEEEYPHLCFDVESIACEIYKFHEVEKWITDLLYQIKRKPLKLVELNELLTAGWGEGDYTTNSTIHVLRVNKTREGLRNTYKKLIADWEAKGMRCLNTQKCKTYEDKKQDPEFLYKRARKEVLRKIKKTGKMPKDATLEKYQVKDEELREIMEEDAPCQPCEKEFYKKGRYWYCFCDKRTDTCSNPDCKEEGLKLGLKVGTSICEHNRLCSVCKDCGGASICEHNRQRSQCKECGGASICDHNRVRSRCKDCGGSQICEHNRVRSRCKECGGSQICEHNRVCSNCKDCGGTSICEHNRARSQCKECGGGSICEHNKHRSACKKCGGSQICEHNKRRSQCKECGGGSICEHNRVRSRCKECGGSSICEHNRVRSNCKDCGGSNICDHNRVRSICKICDPHGHIASLRRSRRGRATNSSNPTHTLDDLCMTTKEWLKYLHKTFEDRYGRPKTEKDEVHIDEIIPCSAWNLPDDNKYCWHYLNSQWLLAEDNLSKHDSFEEEDKLAMIERIQSSTYTSSSEMG